MDARYVFPGGDLAALKGQLLSHAPGEAAAVLLAGRARRPRDLRLLVRESHPVPPEGCLEQGPLRVVVKPEFLAPLIKRARTEGWSLVLAHTHPFGGGDAGEPVRFSPVDDAGEAALMPALFARAPDRPHGTLVLGPGGGFDARVTESPGAAARVVGAIAEVGREVHVYAREPRGPAEEVRPEFDRSVRAFGAEGQAAVGRVTVGIVGLGGIGSLVAEQLAHLGVGRLILLDPDVIEATNLNRVVGSGPADVGLPKVEVAAAHVRRIRPAADVSAHRGTVLSQRDGDLLLDADLVFCCTDSHGSRAVLNQLAYQYLTPTIDLGVVIRVAGGAVTNVVGRAQMLAPGLPCLVCQNFLDPGEVRRDFLTQEERARDPYIVGGAGEPQPAVISLNGTVASLGVTMMLAAVAGFPSPARHQVFVGERGVVRVAASTPDPACVVCSPRGALARGDLWPLPWRRA